MRRPRLRALLLVALALLAACAPAAAETDDVAGRRVRVTTTTNLVTDLVRIVGGDRVEVRGLMGPGVDPHLFRPSAGDVADLADADVILYGGLGLEGKMADLLELLGERRPTAAVTRDLPAAVLLSEPNRPEIPDPHMWFDPVLWQQAARTTAEVLAEVDPGSAGGYRQRAEDYADELEVLEVELAARLAEVPERTRVLVTSHDAFRYFGRRFDVDVVAVQGISTAAEATTADIKRVAAIVADRDVPTVFIESSVPRQTVEAVIAAAGAEGQRVEVGGELFADALGEGGTPEGTYVGMLRANVERIAAGLLGAGGGAAS